MLSRHVNRAVVNSCYLLRNNKFDKNSHQQFSAQVDIKNEPSQDDFAAKWKQARPFSELPGPTKYQFIRGVMPGGKYYKKSITEMMMMIYREYGHIFQVPGMLGTGMVMAMNPDDFPIVFRNEGQWPVRRSFESIVYHRAVHRKDFFQGMEGILSTSGEKWIKVRSIVNPILLQPRNARLYLNTMQEVNNEFLLRIREIRDPHTLEVPEDFEDDINRLTLESIAAVALNTQLGLIRKNRDSDESKAIIKSLRSIFDLAFDLDVMPSLWKYVKTPTFNRMMATLDTLTNISAKYIDQALAKIQADTDGKFTTELGKEKSVLEKLLRHDRRIAVVMALDMMMAGVDTTSTTLTGILLCIAKNPDKQQKLREEVRKFLPHKDSEFTLEGMKNLPYLRACIKEGIRLYPIGPGTGRTLPVDVVLSGYQVPKGIDISIGSNLLLRDEKYVKNANQFKPERWLRDEDNRLPGEAVEPFMYLPFGFGPRSCAGKRIVDLELEITLARLVRNFNIEYNYSIENAFKAKFINVPAIPLKFKFEEVKD